MKIAMVETPFNPTDVEVEELAERLKPCSEQDREVCRRVARLRLLRENIQYARLCCEHVRQMGYVPFASHLFYPQFLPETKEGREAGIGCRDTIARVAGRVFFFEDLGWSRGMKQALTPYMSCSGRRLFPELTTDQVRAHLAALPWREFIEL